MNNGVKIIFAFSLGAAAGAVVSWKLLETKYDKLIQEEVESVKESYSKMKQDLLEKVEKHEIATNKPSIAEMATYINTAKQYADNNDEKGGSESVDNVKPYVILPEECGEEQEYDVISLKYYENDILTYDDTNKIVEDIPGTVGYESLTHFGEYEDDSVFVRNDRLKCYFEILRDYGEYTDTNPTVNE